LELLLLQPVKSMHTAAIKSAATALFAQILSLE
jgi:hypothetical protein